MRRRFVIAALLFAAASVAAGNLESVRSERDPNRRAELALDNAETALTEARNAAAAGDTAKLNSALTEVSASADLCYESLRNSGRSPRRNKYYKKAELKLRSLIRMVDGFGDSVSYSQRDSVTAAERHLQQVHDHILQDEMEAK